MKDLLEFLVKSIVKNKDDVTVEEKKEGRTQVYLCTVNKSDLGAVIGKNGATASAIRTIAKSKNSRDRIVVKFASQE